jgi:membrane protein
MIASVGFLLMVSLMVNTVMDVINTRLLVYFPIQQFHILFLISSSCFNHYNFIYIIFKTLPDGDID